MKRNRPTFKWRHFEPAIILLCVRWYCRYSLSYRDLEEMMSELVRCRCLTESVRELMPPQKKFPQHNRFLPMSNDRSARIFRPKTGSL